MNNLADCTCQALPGVHQPDWNSITGEIVNKLNLNTQDQPINPAGTTQAQDADKTAHADKLPLADSAPDLLNFANFNTSGADAARQVTQSPSPITGSETLKTNCDYRDWTNLHITLSPDTTTSDILKALEEMKMDFATQLQHLDAKVDALVREQEQSTGTTTTLINDLDDKTDKLITEISNITSLITPLSTAFEQHVKTHATSTETNTESVTTPSIDSPDVPSQASITQGNGGSV